jgi:ADP-dependent phosphofructokinase/glucokinase
MSWLNELLSSNRIIEFGKDIKFELYDNHYDFPKEGSRGVIYSTKGWLNIQGEKYIWDHLEGKEMYIEVVF